MQSSHNAQVNIFDKYCGISAAEAARREGIPLKRSGSKEMARCPFHGEKTASLTFYEDGHYHCYGCGAHGDAVSFVAKLRSLTPREAAERLLGGYGGAAPPPPPRDKPDWLVLMAELEAWHKREWDAAMEASAGAGAEADRIREEMERKGISEQDAWDAAWDDGRFTEALLRKSQADILLERLQTTDPDELIALYHERQPAAAEFKAIETQSKNGEIGASA